MIKPPLSKRHMGVLPAMGFVALPLIGALVLSWSGEASAETILRPAAAQEPLFPPCPPESGARQGDPDDFTKKPAAAPEGFLVPRFDPKVRSSVGQGEVPHLDSAYDVDDLLVPSPPPLPIHPYLVPQQGEEYLRPEEGAYRVYSPRSKAQPWEGPWKCRSDAVWRIRVYTELQNQVDILKGGPQELAIYRLGGDIGADLPVGDTNEFQFELGTRYSRYDWEVVLPGPPTFQQVWNDYLNLRYFHNDPDDFNLMAFASGIAGEQENANWSGSLYGKIGIGAQIALDEDVHVGGAVGLMSQQEGHAFIYPIPWITWNFDEHWRLATDWNHTSGFALSYNPNRWESYRLKGFWDLWQFRLRDGGAFSETAVQDERLGVSIGAEWKTSEFVTFWVDAGVYVYQEVELHSNPGAFLGALESNPAPFLQAGLMVNF